MKSWSTATRYGRPTARLLILACVILPVLAACGGAGGGSSGSSTMSLGITDGPIDSASSVVISITGVELKPAGGGQAVTFDFSNSPKTIDLLTEQNGNEDLLLNNVTLPVGNYDWIRLLVNAAPDGTVANSYITINGAQYPLVIPSGAQTGLKLVQSFTLTANQNAQFTIDFMLAQSITAHAPPGQTSSGQQVYFLRPALRLVNDTQVGTISGTVALSSLHTADTTIDKTNPSNDCLSGSTTGTSGPLPNAHVYIFSGSNSALTDVEYPPPNSSYVNPVVASITYSSSSNTYTYDQPFLQTGNYTAVIACGPDDPSTVDTLSFVGPNGVIASSGANVTVTANQTTTQDF